MLLFIALITGKKTVANLSPLRVGLDSGSVHVKLVVENVTRGQCFLPVLQFPLSQSFEQCSVLTFIYTSL